MKVLIRCYEVEETVCRMKLFNTNLQVWRQALLENLPLLEGIKHPGKTGNVFEGWDDFKPNFEGMALRLHPYYQAN